MVLQVECLVCKREEALHAYRVAAPENSYSFCIFTLLVPTCYHPSCALC